MNTTKRTRGKGEGSIYPVTKRVTRNGKAYTYERWVGTVEVGERGKRKRATVERKTRAEVVKALKRLHEHKDQGITPDTDTSLSDYLDWYLERTNVGKKQRTKDAYRQRAERAKERIGHIRYFRLTVDDVEYGFKGKLVTDGYSANYVNECLRVLREALDYGIANDKLPKNVVSFVAGVKPDYKVDDTLSEDEANQVLDTAHRNRDRLYGLWWFALSYALRPDEAYSLLPENVALYDTPRETSTGGKTYGTLSVIDSKTESGLRDIPLTENAAAVMRQHLARQTVDSRYVFHDVTGRKLSNKRVGEAFNALLREVGTIKHICNKCPKSDKCTHGDQRPCKRCRCSTHLRRFYMARHTAATLLLEHDVDLEIVKAICGHDKIETTLGHYAKVKADLQRRGLESTPLKVHDF